MCEFANETKVIIAAKTRNSDRFQYVRLMRYVDHCEFELTDSREFAYPFCDPWLAEAVCLELRLADDTFYYGDLRVVEL